jgi:MraZ protein
MSSEQNSLPEFAGEFCHGLDSKNRITIPSRWRQSDADEFFLMPDRENKFLRAMPPGQFRAVADKVAADPTLSNSDRAVFMRHFYSRAQHASADKQGRLLLPEDYCKRLGLSGEVVLVGAHDRFEIWNKEVWKSTQETEAAIFGRALENAGL